VPADATRSHAQRSVDAEDRLTQALAELIAEQGFERTTAAQIGERAGYSRAAVRDRYGSKEALLLALHGRYERLLMGDDGAGPNPSLATALARLVTFARERPVWLRAIFVVSFESVGASAGFAPTVQQWISTLEAAGRRWIQEGQLDGSVSLALDPGEQARRLLDEAIAGAFRWTLDPAGSDYSDVIGRWGAGVQRRLAP